MDLQKKKSMAFGVILFIVLFSSILFLFIQAENKAEEVTENLREAAARAFQGYRMTLLDSFDYSDNLQELKSAYNEMSSDISAANELSDYLSEQERNELEAFEEMYDKVLSDCLPISQVIIDIQGVVKAQNKMIQLGDRIYGGEYFTLAEVQQTTADFRSAMETATESFAEKIEEDLEFYLIRRALENFYLRFNISSYRIL